MYVQCTRENIGGSLVMKRNLYVTKGEYKKEAVVVACDFGNGASKGRPSSSDIKLAMKMGWEVSKTLASNGAFKIGLGTNRSIAATH
jgi:hypothetical protein